MTDTRILARTLYAICPEHSITPEPAPGRAEAMYAICEACRRYTREARLSLLSPRPLPKPRYAWWWERKTTSPLDAHYTYGTCGGYGPRGVKPHKRDGFLGDCGACGACWQARLEHWCESVAQWHPATAVAC